MLNFKFDWDPLLELHIPDIDTQHKHFFKIGRYIEQLLLTHCAGVTEEQLLNLLYELRDYVTYHFYSEEQLMEQINFPEIEAHKLEHQTFLDYINHIDYTKLCEHPYEQLTILREEMVYWSFNHMVQQDQKLTHYYKKQIILHN